MPKQRDKKIAQAKTNIQIPGSVAFYDIWPGNGVGKCYLEAAMEALCNVIVCKFLSYHYVVTSQAVGGFPFWNVGFNFNFFLNLM